MNISVRRWLWPSGHTPDHATSLRKLLEAASEVGFYRCRVHESDLTDPWGALQRLPPASLDLVLSRPDLFRRPTAREAQRAVRLPHGRTLRTAVLDPNARSKWRQPAIWPPKVERIQRFAPEAIAAPEHVLMELAARIRDHSASVPSLTHAIVVKRSIAEGPLPEGTRRMFWKAFQVPVFEQVEWFDGQVIAYECDAHSGLHFAANQMIADTTPQGELLLTCLTSREFPILKLATGYQADLLAGVCGCGEVQTRLFWRAGMPIRPMAQAAYSH